ncbi:asparagine synthase (glutamine-hydrolyzing) [Paraburkholderia susongensis]|uniref:asparagine synthase (glutamine-hydrolyzing) n=1 Tax=Paraburkholderia susongensis TaxID=1515439 RepID=A0A1X7LM63_9BURK|nr:asparagine synthase (glutamine-hydrolyzing) [Paraburkholderia susongensis]SMG54423.1 asparagine synthase (glutamine-hydrolysing) [Paraburkholderia susongensis]
MCGYVAIFSKQPREFKADQVNIAMDTIHHRGPDSRSIWIDPNGRVAFGYVRLGLVGLSNGTQPIVADEGDFVMMVNGEFYDYARIRAELEEQGCRFKTSSDSEIALHLYRRHGVRGLKQLRGEFAILIYDRLRETLFAVRDRIGVKPLYYAEHDGAFYFGSEIKAMVGAGLPPQWDRDAYANRGFILRDRTLFNGVRSVKPGTFLLADSCGLQEKTYWDWQFPARAEMDHNRSEASMIERVRSAIEDAVRLRLHADVPVGVSLSGGLDSSAMLGLATALVGKPLQAFHLSFEGADGYDERRYAEIAAKHNNAELHVLSVSQDDLADHFEDALWHTEIPFSNAHSIAKYMLCKFIQSKGMRAVLTGEGADEVFAGYPHYRRDMVMFNNDHQDRAEIQRLADRIESQGDRFLEGPTVDVQWVNNELGHGIAWMETQSALFRPLAGLFRNGYRERHAHATPYQQFFNRLGGPSFDEWDPVNKSLYAVAKSSLPNLVLTTLGDRLEMAGSLEGRPPLLDHRVVEVAASLPVWMKIRGSVEKYALREAMRAYLPHEIYDRKKQYFRAPPSLLHPKSKMFQLVADTLSGPLLNSLPFFEPSSVRDFMAAARLLPEAQRAAADHILMEITGLCLLQKRFSLS